MKQRNVRPPADNNVDDVINTIDNYTCGPIRALAQDPPQNSADARLNGQSVHVEYRLFVRHTAEGKPIRLLTITDQGTTGLDGPILTGSDLDERERSEGGLVIRQGENWAAWEAMRYTKEGEDKLGSRGQGKYAYLYHSMHFPPGVPAGSARHLSRMIILYDTLLPGGDYRLGVRYHNPAAHLVDPPFVGDEAREVVRGSYEDDHFKIPLELEPLDVPGTRVVIPFLGDETWETIQSGELVHWLRTQWWRKIQKKELEIRVVTEDGLEQVIGVPSFWKDAPWAGNESQYYLRENVPLSSDTQGRRRIIKRVVLTHEETSAVKDREGPGQWNGVQVLRGGQWITTLEVTEFSDWLPREYREGFRGFVEFDKSLERELRVIENPVHDGYNKRAGLYQEIVRKVKEQVHEFAIEQGWTEPEEPAPEPQSDEIVREFAQLFVDSRPGESTDGDINWNCSVEASYPRDEARLDWNEFVGVRAICKRTPASDGDLVSFQAFLIRPDGTRRRVLGTRSQALRGRSGVEYSRAGADFGDLPATHPGAESNPLFPEAGRYSLEVVCAVEGEQVARGLRSFYVAAEIPRPPQRGVTLQLEAGNARTGSRSIDFEESLSCSAIVRNYRNEPVQGSLVVAIQGEPYILIREDVSLSPSLPGDRAESLTLSSEDKKVVKDGMSSSSEDLILEPGEYVLLASLEHQDEIIATSSLTIVVGPDMDEEGGDLPFLVVPVLDQPLAPRWELEDPARAGDPHMLRYSERDRVYMAVRDLLRPVKGSRRRPADDYLSEIIAEGLVEWAVREARSRGDEGRIRLVGRGIAAISRDLSDRIEDRIDRLMSALEDPVIFGGLQRELAALMLEAARMARN